MDDIDVQVNEFTGEIVLNRSRKSHQQEDEVV